MSTLEVNFRNMMKKSEAQHGVIKSLRQNRTLDHGSDSTSNNKQISSAKHKLQDKLDEDNSNALKMRSKDHRDEKDRADEDILLKAYLHQYIQLVKKMAAGYKREAIDSYITESFCTGPRYTSKHAALIEKALYG